MDLMGIPKLEKTELMLKENITETFNRTVKQNKTVMLTSEEIETLLSDKNNNTTSSKILPETVFEIEGKQYRNITDKVKVEE